MRHYCRYCDGEGSIDMACSCHGKSVAYNCVSCGNCGYREGRCDICNGSGELDSWEDVRYSLQVKHGNEEYPEDTSYDDYLAFQEELKDEDRAFGYD